MNETDKKVIKIWDIPILLSANNITEKQLESEIGTFQIISKSS